MALCTDAERNRFVNCSLRDCMFNAILFLSVCVCMCFWFYLNFLKIILAQNNLFDPKIMGSNDIRNILCLIFLWETFSLWIEYENTEEKKKSYTCHKFIARVHPPRWELHVLCFRMYVKSPGDHTLCDTHIHTAALCM